MDKQRDFEKGWEEYKAKKKQEVEEIGQDIADICSDMALNCCGSTPCYACIAKRLERKGYRKIPEVRKETAEKFAERLKEKLNEWLEDNEDLNGKIDFGIAEIELIGVKSLKGEVIAESLIDEIAKEITEGKV